METKGKRTAAKKVLSLLLAVAMLFSITAGIELSAYAATSGDYEYEILDDGTVEITLYSGSASELTIPAAINGKKVTSIGEYAFESCESLSGVIIPNSVKNLGEGAFVSCDSLTNVTIPNSVKSIGDGAFSACVSLISVAIPNSVTNIGEGVFSACVSLTSVTIPGSVTSIGEGAFYECESLLNVNVDSNNKTYSSVNGVLYNKGKTELILYPAGKTAVSFTIPSSVTGIAAGAFAGCTYLTSILIPNSVKSIGEMAFFGCPSLTSVTIPSSVTSIGDGAFFVSESLESVNVDSNNKNYASADGVLYNKSKTELIIFPAGKAAASFTIPNSVTSIDEGAFFGCEGLAKITIPSSVKSIGDAAFFACTGLTNVTIPSSVTSIGELAFLCGEDLTKITIYSKNVKIADFAIPETAEIYGYKGSTAESYAKEYGNKFVALSETKLATPTMKAAVNANGSFKLSWNKVSGAEKYELYIKQADGSFKLMKTTTATSFTTAVGAYGYQYTYKMRAVKGNTKSAYSSAVNAKNTKKLQTPAMKAPVKANGSFKLSWNKVSGAEKYELYIKQADGSYKLMKTTTGTSFTTAFATYGKQFSYKMRAVTSKNSSATSAYSAVVNATNNKKLQTPTMKATVNANGTFKLSWNKVAGAEKYELYIKQADGSYKLMKTTTGTSFTTAFATYGKQFSYKMRAVTSKNNSATSAFSSVVNATNNKKLQTPTMKAAVNANGSFKLSWNAVAGATSYKLYIKQADGSYKLMKTTSATSFTTAVAAKGKTYSYKMVAVTSKNKNATSNYSNVVSAKRK